jgi:hypothetical protein
MGDGKGKMEDVVKLILLYPPVLMEDGKCSFKIPIFLT